MDKFLLKVHSLLIILSNHLIVKHNTCDLRAVSWDLDQFSVPQVCNGSVMSELWDHCSVPSESMF